MKQLLILLFLISSRLSSAQYDIPAKNFQVIDTVLKYGRSISPTYEKAVCTELVIGVLGHFIEISRLDTVNIRIDQPRESLYDVYRQIEDGSPEPKGVYYALTSNGKGEAIDRWEDVRPGDFVQFWYPKSYGHCGIVSTIDLNNRKMRLHSSFPSTDGYGIQEFDIPDYCFFVRLK